MGMQGLGFGTGDLRSMGTTTHAAWVQKEASKHTTPDSIEQRIALAHEHLRELNRLSPSAFVTRARKAHTELIQVLSERLARAEIEAP